MKKEVKKLLPIVLLVAAVVMICFIAFPVKMDQQGNEDWDLFFGWVTVGIILSITAVILFIRFIHNASEDQYGHNMTNHFEEMDADYWDLKVPKKIT